MRARVLLGGKQVGSLTATLVYRPSACFFELCDFRSGELYDVAKTLFKSDGTPRHRVLRSDPALASVPKGKGGLLYITTLKLDAAQRAGGATDVGAAAVRALLSHARLKGRWDVAAYICDSETELTQAECNRLEEMRLAHFYASQDPEYETDSDEEEERAKEQQRVDERLARDARQFLRAGFREAAPVMATEGPRWLLCATRAMLAAGPPMTHAQALAFPLAAARAPAKTPAKGKGPKPSRQQRKLAYELRTCFQQMGRLPARANDDEWLYSNLGHLEMRDRAEDLLAVQGACPKRACALHMCAIHNQFAFFSWLWHYGADVNAADEYGWTPLMLAASRMAQTDRFGCYDTRAVAELILLGADKDATDTDGFTALGHFYMAIREHNDIVDTNCRWGDRRVPDSYAVTLLLPAGGPTAADLEAGGRDFIAKASGEGQWECPRCPKTYKANQRKRIAAHQAECAAAPPRSRAKR